MVPLVILPMVPLVANGTIGITIGTNGITNGTICKTLNDIGIPLGNNERMHGKQLNLHL